MKKIIIMTILFIFLLSVSVFAEDIKLMEQKIFQSKESRGHSYTRTIPPYEVDVICIDGHKYAVVISQQGISIVQMMSWDGLLLKIIPIRCEK